MERPSALAPAPASAPAGTPWLPVVLASAAAAVVALWTLLWLFAAATFLGSPGDMMPPGVRAIDPSTAEVAGTIVRRVGLPLLVVLSLVATWHSAYRRRARGCWLAALATIGLAVASFIA